MHSSFHLGVFSFPLDPFKDLDAKTIADQLDAMSAVLRKLVSTFSSLPGPWGVIQEFTDRIRKFIQYSPILDIICDNAVRARHWETVSGVVFLH